MSEEKLENIVEKTKRLRHRRKSLVDELKKAPCTDCKLTFHPIAMDFDHVRGAKVAEISKLARSSVSIDTVIAEIAKCELVCANCHRIRTFKSQESACDKH